VTVDAERLTSAYLRAHPLMQAIVGDRIYTELPSRAAFPLVKITLIGGEPVFSYPLYLDEAFLQFDCYGGPKVQARLLVDTVRELLAQAEFQSVHELGVVNSVRFGSLHYLPDDSFEPPKPRFIAEASLFTRPRAAI
jgi:hypothetical protein